MLFYKILIIQNKIKNGRSNIARKLERTFLSILRTTIPKEDKRRDILKTRELLTLKT